MISFFPAGIQSIPLDIPRIAVDNAERWKDLYMSRRQPLTKTGINHNGFDGAWVGMDIYRGPNYDLSKDIYTSPYVDCSELFPNMIKTILEHIPMDINCVRCATSVLPFIPHHDYSTPILSCRTLLIDQHPEPNFFYVNSNGEKVFQTMPQETNTWMYDDSEMMHGSDKKPNLFKVLLMYYGKPIPAKVTALANRSMAKFSEFVIKVS
jgi:hypothetical protein